MYAISPERTIITNISSELIVSAEECGNWLNLSPSAIIKQTDLLEGLIKSVTEIVENYTWLSLRQTTFEALFDLQDSIIINGLKLSLQRAPILELANITKIEYLNNSNTWTEFDRGTMTIEGLYENVTEKQEMRQWASIKFIEDVPFQDRCNAYKIRVTFIAGYDPIETEISLKIPETIKTAIKQIVAFYYTYRGDCASECSLDGNPVPCTAKGMLDQISIKNTIIGGSYTPGGSCGC